MYAQNKLLEQEKQTGGIEKILAGPRTTPG
jgi:hypothetical protein